MSYSGSPSSGEGEALRRIVNHAAAVIPNAATSAGHMTLDDVRPEPSFPDSTIASSCRPACSGKGRHPAGTADGFPGLDDAV